MTVTPIMPRVAAICGAIVLGGWVSGCSLFAPKPLDCGAVALQAESGRDDAEIASVMDTTPQQIALCHEAEKTAALGDSAALP